MTWTTLALYCLAAYLIGAIPFSWVFVRALKGIDLRIVGSGNLGSTNALRVLGVKWGLAIQALDILKGWLPVAFAQSQIILGPTPWGDEPMPVFSLYQVLAVGLAAVLGHMFPIYLKFRGGKGVNTSLGVFLALAPKATLVALAVGLAVLAIWRYVSLGSITGAVVFAAAAWFFYRGQTALIIVALLTALLIIVMHRANIQRLLAGTESRLGKKVSTEGLREEGTDSRSL